MLHLSRLTIAKAVDSSAAIPDIGKEGMFISNSLRLPRLISKTYMLLKCHTMTLGVVDMKRRAKEGFLPFIAIRCPSPAGFIFSVSYNDSVHITLHHSSKEAESESTNLETSP